MKFDGKEYKDIGPNAGNGTASGKRIDSHTIDRDNKLNGKTLSHTEYKVSEDGKTLTITATFGKNTAKTVFDRQ